VGGRGREGVAREIEREGRWRERYRERQRKGRVGD
jgi:hypothetical protein